MSENPWRHLWADDPFLAGPDPLDLHNLDYALEDLAGSVGSAWRIGLGYPKVENESEDPIDANGDKAQLSDKDVTEET